MKRLMLLAAVLVSLLTYAQSNSTETFFEDTTPNVATSELKTDGLIQPHLTDFLNYCDAYGIQYHDKLFKLKEIAIVDSLKMSRTGGTLGLQVRNENKEVEKIIFSWMTLIDKEILKVVAFHEFGHYFLEYDHICHDCDKIMAEVNTSYYSILNDWDNQVQRLFMESPAYLKQAVAQVPTTAYPNEKHRH